MPAKRPNLTHFLCIPLVNSTSRPQLQASLRQFANDVAIAPAIEIPNKDIKHVGSLHLTLGVMSLETKERLDTACVLLHSPELIRSIREATKFRPVDPIRLDEPTETTQSPLSQGTDSGIEIQKLEPQVPSLRVNLLGLCAMRSPESTSVLFARPIDSTDRLFNLCLAIRQIFVTANLLERGQDSLLLHATVVNIRYNGASKRSRRLKGIDARDLIKKYDGFEWAKDVNLEKVSICRMRAEKIVEDDRIVDEAYTEVDHLPLL